MGIIELNKFIDFPSLFVTLYEEQIDVLEADRFELDFYQRLINFYEGGFAAFDLQREECMLSDDKIHFAFGMDSEQANESSNYGATSNYFIIYDRILEQFEACDYEQG